MPDALHRDRCGDLFGSKISKLIFFPQKVPTYFLSDPYPKNISTFILIILELSEVIVRSACPGANDDLIEVRDELTSRTDYSDPSGVLITLVIPSLSRDSLKFISKPSGLSAKRKYVNSCFLWSPSTLTTDFSSTIT